ncbi:Htur_1727 family rSAM-partnered candidate RiPP [Halopenitus salinus]|uniref:Htur_1727 family rSAM-partnered candidate RiPP n=1 Tax=Halopenitus salinus TaxID=1198295 RepID=A0ABD5UUS2_9EURY
MVEKANRSSEASPRATTERRWEVFVREEVDDPLSHVGTIAAPAPDVAREEASKLFAWYARDLWVCPADETHRYSTYTLGEGASGDADDGTDEREGRGGSGGTDDASACEPRVYEETEGTPEVGGSPE